MGVNDLYELPPDMGKMVGLENLDLHDNLLEALPDSLCKMPVLMELDVSDNKIKTFPGKFDGLRARCKVSMDNQSAYKTREPLEGLQPGEVQTDSPRGSIMPDDDEDV